jgi:hypothetical protein
VDGKVLFGDEDYLFIEGDYEPDTEAPEEEVDGEPVTSYMWVLDKKQIGSGTKQWMKTELGVHY